MKTYEIANAEVTSKIKALIEAYHPKLEEAGVTIHALFARNSGGPAVTHGGYAALAVVRIVSLKDRVKGMRDAEIVIDEENFEELSDAQKDGLLDHELHHLETVADDDGGFERDKAGRPKLRMKTYEIAISTLRAFLEAHNADEKQWDAIDNIEAALLSRMEGTPLSLSSES